MNKDTETRFIGYARVSTEEQSLQMQMDALKAFGVAGDHIVTDTATGATMSREGLRFLVNRAEEGDVVVVWKLDRLGRSLRGVLGVIETLQNKGVGLKSLTEDIDSTTPSGKMMVSMLLSFAEYERNIISERTKEGLAARKRQGMKLGRKHFVLDYPKRKTRFRELIKQGRIPNGGMSGQQVIDEMNAIDPDAPKVKAAQSYHNWKRQGFKGIEPPAQTEDNK